MTIVIICVATGLFFLAFSRLDLVGLSYQVMSDSNGALRMMADPALDDAAKEAGTRRLTVKMLGLFGRIMVRLSAALAVPAALIWLTIVTNFTNVDLVWTVSMSWPFIAANVIAFCGVFYWQYRT